MVISHQLCGHGCVVMVVNHRQCAPCCVAGLQTGDQLMMINGHKLTDITVAEAERILDEAYGGPKVMFTLVHFTVVWCPHVFTSQRWCPHLFTSQGCDVHCIK